MKFVTAGTASTITSTFQGVALNDIAQGSDVTNRIGDTAIARLLMFRYFAGSWANNTAMRLLVFIDKLVQGTPGETNVLISAGPLAMRNPEYSPRFRFLADIPLSKLDTESGAEPIQRVLKIPLRVPMTYTAGTSTSQLSNKLWFMFVSDNATGDSVTWSSVLYFQDP